MPDTASVKLDVSDVMELNDKLTTINEELAGAFNELEWFAGTLAGTVGELIGEIGAVQGLLEELVPEAVRDACR